jgi:hypothetical protein
VSLLRELRIATGKGCPKHMQNTDLLEIIEIYLNFKHMYRNMLLRLEYVITTKICICAYVFSKSPGPTNDTDQNVMLPHSVR